MENKIKNKSNKFIIIAFIIILIIQILAIIYATNKRQWLHMDELYSYGLMNYKRAFIYENNDFIYNWHSSDYFKDYLVINSDEKWDWNPIYNNQVEDVHPPLYYLLLRIFCSFNINNFSIWTGIILNILLFICSNIILYLIGKKIFNNNYYALFLCVLNGFSIASVENVIYIRMYQLFTLNVLILIYWHLYKLDKEKFTIITDLIPLSFIIIIGFLSHYYYAIIVIILYIMYVIKYLKNKNYDNLLKYTVSIVVSVLTSIMIFPYLIKHIFFGYRGKGIIYKMSLLSIKQLLNTLVENISLLNSEVFNGWMYLIICIILALIVLSFIIKNKKIVNINKEKIIYVFIPMLVYFLITILISPYCEIRYIMPIVPLIFTSILYLAIMLLESILEKKEVINTIFILITIFGISLIPKLSNNIYTYKEYENINKIIEQSVENKPVIYFYKNYKIMDTYKLLLSSNSTYIIPWFDTDSFIEIIKSTDISNGLIVVIDSNQKRIILDKIIDMNLFKDNINLFSINEYDVILFK